MWLRERLSAFGGTGRRRGMLRVGVLAPKRGGRQGARTPRSRRGSAPAGRTRAAPVRHRLPVTVPGRGEVVTDLDEATRQLRSRALPVTPPPTVQITVTVGEQLTLRVEDDGVGLPADAMPVGKRTETMRTRAVDRAGSAR